MRTSECGAVLLALVVAACQNGAGEAGGEATDADRAEYERSVAAVDSTAEAAIASVGHIAGPLRTLNPEQQASLAALLAVTREVAQASVVLGERGDRLTTALRAELQDICPPMRQMPPSAGCLDADVAYMSALAECDRDGRDESECPAAWEAGAASFECHLRAFETLVAAIRVLPGRRWPPQPFPWMPSLPGSTPGGQAPL